MKKVGGIKYWYAIDRYVCVLCGKEKVYKQRVYSESEKKNNWIDDLCWTHKF